MNRAMILAAGRGERLKPLTDTTPKPLIEVGGRPLIEHHLAGLAQAGFTDVVINLGWLGQKIREALGAGQRFGLSLHYSVEPPGALETAGGIVQALPLLGTEPFLVVSADAFTDYPFERLLSRPVDHPAHLVLVDNPDHHRHGDFALEDDLVRIDGDEKFTFSGIARFQPSLFTDLAPGRRALRPVLESAIAAERVSGERYAGLWADIGTPARLAAAREASGV